MTPMPPPMIAEEDVSMPVLPIAVIALVAFVLVVVFA